MANRCRTHCTITGPDAEIERFKRTCLVTEPPPRPGYDYGNGIDFERAQWKPDKVVYQSTYFVEGGQHRVHTVPVVGRTDATVAGWQEVDPFALLCFLHRDVLVAALDKEIGAESDDAHVLTREQREQARATMANDLLATDRELSELIWIAQEQNLPHEFRAGVSPLAVLALQLVNVTHKAESTTPGWSFDLHR
jgi:hypothetical protein